MVDFYLSLVYVMAYLGLFAAIFYLLSLSKYYKKEQPKEATDKTVSIIIPAYNEEKSIARTIESALELDYPKDKYEIIVVNDGSTDNTYEIAKKYISENAPIVRVLTKTNGGKSSALNLGINNSKAEIIVTMDADTFTQKEALKRMVGHFYEDNIMAVTPSVGVYKPRTVWQRIQHIEYYLGVFLAKSFSSIDAIHVTPGAFSSYRREFFVKYGGYDKNSITEDFEIALRIQRNDYRIENAANAVVYTLAPKTFRELAVQRRRWYSGTIKNLWEYRELFGIKKGALGFFILPLKVIGIFSTIILTFYLTSQTLDKVRETLLSLNAINFNFQSIFELNQFVLSHFITNLLSNPLFLIGVIFTSAFFFYIKFAKGQMRFQESLKLNIVLFFVFYSFLFTFWWIVSVISILLNRKVSWRESKDVN